MDFIVLFSFNSVAPQQLNPPREYPTTFCPSPDSDKALISANLPELLAVPEQISFTRYPASIAQQPASAALIIYLLKYCQFSIFKSCTTMKSQTANDINRVYVYIAWGELDSRGGWGDRDGSDENPWRVSVHGNLKNKSPSLLCGILTTKEVLVHTIQLWAFSLNNWDHPRTDSY